MRILALVRDQDEVRRFLQALGEPTEPPKRAPAQSPALLGKSGAAHPDRRRVVSHPRREPPRLSGTDPAIGQIRANVPDFRAPPSVFPALHRSATARLQRRLAPPFLPQRPFNRLRTALPPVRRLPGSARATRSRRRTGGLLGRAALFTFATTAVRPCRSTRGTPPTPMGTDGKRAASTDPRGRRRRGGAYHPS